MGRRPRVEYNGAVYHVIQRGSNREYIFDQDEDKKCFLDLLKTISCDLGAVVFAYVIMSNHYHLVLRTDDAPLSKIMQQLIWEVL